MRGDQRERLQYLAEVCCQLGYLSTAAAARVDDDWWNDWQACLAVETMGTQQAALRVISHLSADGVSSETYLTARQKSGDAIVVWINLWIATGEFWPDEAFNYGCP